jgi:peroxiredoxin
LQAILGDLDKLGATLAALTPQRPEHNQTMREKHALNFHLLSDPDNAYAARLGLRFQVPDKLREIYLSFGLDLSKYNGDDSWSLPIPARFVVDRTGIVRVADVDVDYTRRPEASKTVADLRALA